MGWRDKRSYRDRPERIRRSTHPPEGQHSRIICEWHGDSTGYEVAQEFSVAAVTVYAIWSAAKKAGKLPKRRRVNLSTRARSPRGCEYSMSMKVNAARSEALG